MGDEVDKKEDMVDSSMSYDQKLSEQKHIKYVIPENDKLMKQQKVIQDKFLAKAIKKYPIKNSDINDDMLNVN